MCVNVVRVETYEYALIPLGEQFSIKPNDEFQLFGTPKEELFLLRYADI